MKKTKVLIVDDSSVIRKLLTHIIQSDDGLEVVGTAPDPYIARDKLISLKPDVMTLDVEMPRMDGITFLQKVMEHQPIPTVMISSLTAKNSETAIQALEAGAVAIVQKPDFDVTKNFESMGSEIIRQIKSAARANVGILKTSIAKRPNKELMPSAALAKTTHQLLAIASSTGGTEALKRVLPLFPPNIPGTLVVQHMPPVFSTAFAKRLNEMCSFEVREAKDGDRVRPGLALIAPGNFHMTLSRNGAIYTVKLNEEPQVHGVRPAADILFKSVAKYAGSNAIGLVLTGMGKDGALGLKQMKDAGSFNFAQDKETSVVFGMPKEAIENNAIDKVLGLDKISEAIISQMKKRGAM